jgi:hypothetical protein
MAKKYEYGVIAGTLAYMKVAQPDTKYESTDLEYSVDVIVDKKAAKEWNKQFQKQKAKEIDATDFEAKFKVPLPKELEGEEEVFAIKLKKGATKGGEVFDEKYRPKLLLDTAEGRVDITVSRLAANGTKGKVSYLIDTNSFGTFARLNNILVAEEDFIEFERASGGAGSEFGGAKPIAKVEPESKAATASRPKASPKKQEEPEEDDDSASPF